MDLKPNELLERALLIWEYGYKLTKNPRWAYFFLKYLAPSIYNLSLNDFAANLLKDRIAAIDKFAYESMGQGMLSVEELKAVHHGLKAVIDSVGGTLEAAKRDEPVVWFDYTIPSVILDAFEVKGICTSMFSKAVNYAGSDYAVGHLEAAENAGITSEMCSMTRIPVGAYFLEQLPKPIAVLSTAHPCDSGRSASQLLDYLSEAPTFTMDSPYDREEDSIGHYAENLWEMIRFLENHLGRKMNWDKLKESIGELNQFNHYLREVAELHRAIPSPGLGFITLELIWPIRLFAAGSASGTKVAELLYEISKKRVENKKERRTREKKEKVRVMLSGAPVYFVDTYLWMQKEFGAYVVADYLVQTTNPEIDTSSKDSMIKGLATDNLNLGMVRQSHGTVELIIEDIENLIDQYAPDCIIFCGNVHCKHKKSVPKIIKDTCKKSGIPTLNMQLDLFDKRANSEEEIKRQIKEFFISSGLVK